jgi:hypothetical protein
MTFNSLVVFVNGREGRGLSYCAAAAEAAARRK